jgi:hypothetical protein
VVARGGAAKWWLEEEQRSCGGSRRSSAVVKVEVTDGAALRKAVARVEVTDGAAGRLEEEQCSGGGDEVLLAGYFFCNWVQRSKWSDEVVASEASLSDRGQTGGERAQCVRFSTQLGGESGRSRSAGVAGRRAALRQAQY